MPSWKLKVTQEQIRQGNGAQTTGFRLGEFQVWMAESENPAVIDANDICIGSGPTEKEALRAALEELNSFTNLTLWRLLTGE